MKLLLMACRIEMNRDNKMVIVLVYVVCTIIDHPFTWATRFSGIISSQCHDSMEARNNSIAVCHISQYISQHTSTTKNKTA